MSTPLFELLETKDVTTQKPVGAIPVKEKRVVSPTTLPPAKTERQPTVETKSSVETKQPVQEQRPLSITELTLQVKSTIETSFEFVWVAGQISNLTYHQSGHIYLTLKDDGAMLSAVIWKSNASKIKFKLSEGLEMICRGRLDVFAKQGKYQLSISSVEPQGIGGLELAFRQLHQKLAGEGLFDSRRKKQLPSLIRRVAVITSPTGAAIQDFLRILGRRTQLTDVLFVPAKVQGDGAAEEIVRALQTINRLAPVERIDCIVLTRGGGSIEDLWAFNEEPLVRAVAASDLPVVSAVGHEVDTTLCDYAADVRAATPSEAAERISKDDSERRRNLIESENRLHLFLEHKLRRCAEKLKTFDSQPFLRHPERILENRHRLVDLYEERLHALMNQHLQSGNEKVTRIAAEIEALSPLAILGRGYTLTETEDGKRIKNVSDVSSGAVLRTRLSDGTIESVCR